MKTLHTFFTLLLLASGLMACNAQSTTGFTNISEKEFAEKAQAENTIILDVRTPQEVAEGRIAGASLFIDINDSQFAEKMQALDKSKTYLVYCRSGARSSKASSWMAENGFSQVYNLKGGILGWSGTIEK
ncbi:rhodanese-like domain-containing protein [Cytophagales bacterium LB-30]|uniref:Rhodanese-like domain-containing protein n=1 Tax=Shiella aurantiaca TaxID=3058365 RepID=A0ABT8F8I2_9BACT|nr:rhodanese-like domain-containing protein [Shiella aurantiaca]MDN4166684.1 rhodanese-like domain-containing protein [Shiella aurantiaca]